MRNVRAPAWLGLAIFAWGIPGCGGVPVVRVAVQGVMPTANILIGKGKLSDTTGTVALNGSLNQPLPFEKLVDGLHAHDTVTVIAAAPGGQGLLMVEIYANGEKKAAQTANTTSPALVATWDLP